MSSTLKATGAFANVAYGTADDLASAAADQFPLVLIEPKAWSEALDSDPAFTLRRVVFVLRIAVRKDLPRDRYEALDGLMTVARAALSGSTLGGGCLSTQTRLLDGQFDRAAKQPEGVHLGTGQFAYRIATT